jgi:hypothetical protein
MQAGKLSSKMPEPEERPSSNSPEPAVAAELRSLLKKAKSGDATVLPRMREIVSDHPELWEQLGDATRIVEQAWADLLCGGDPLVRESIKQQAEQMRAELEGQHPTPVEKILVANVIGCWLEAQYAQLDVASTTSGPMNQAKFSMARAEASQKKLLAATKTLSLVRSLLPQGLVPIVSAPKLFEPRNHRIAQ